MKLDLKVLRAEGHKALQRNYWRSCFLSTLMMVLSFATVITAIVDFVNEAPTAIYDTYVNLTSINREINLQVIAMVITFVFGMILLTAIIRIVVSIFVKNPAEVGVCLFMKHSQDPSKTGMAADMAYAYDHGYMNHVKCMLVTRFITYMWAILLIVPGIYKHYEYKLVPYLLSEREGLTPKEARALSSKMMMGYKMQAFLLDLSFIPWHVAGIIMLGLLEIFFVAPYKHQTDAAFFEKVKSLYNAAE